MFISAAFGDINVNRSMIAKSNKIPVETTTDDGSFYCNLE